jgi:3D (Asp-Asp-Asp) domain-containing protein
MAAWIVKGLLIFLLDAGPVECQVWKVTGYVHTGNRTASGMVTYGNEWAIAAAHYRIPFGYTIDLEGIEPLSIQDRGRLSANHIDVLVNSVAEAYALTGHYWGCLYAPD